jgi:hypothetical protein
MPKTTTIVTGAAAIVSAAALAIAGASFAGAGNSGYAVPGAAGATPSASSQPSEGYGRGDRQAPVHTDVTGDELTKVTDAIKAKDSSLTVTKVMKDADGSYDAFGTKSDGTQVRVEVSKDLATIEVSTGGPGGRGGLGGHGPRDGQGGMGNHTAVTGDELAKVTAAVKAKDSAVTVTTVLKDADGSYDAIGTKAGNPVRVEVSKDLKTVEVGTGFGGGGRHGFGPRDGSAPSGTPSSPSSPSGTASTAAYRV